MESYLYLGPASLASIHSESADLDFPLYHEIMFPMLLSKRVHRKCLDTIPKEVRSLIPLSARNVSCTKVIAVIMGVVIIYYIVSWSTDGGKKKGKFEITASDEERIFSQIGEDGVLKRIFEQIGVTDETYVEFGTQDASQINTRVLRERDGWTGLLMDGSNENADINLHKELIFDSNIVELFQKYSVPKQMDLLSTDTDWKDFWISKAILEGGYQPRVIISEINSSFRKDLAITVPADSAQQFGSGTYYFGATPMAMIILYKQFGYSLVYCEKRGVNCFWVRDDELSTDDVVRLNEKQQILDTIACAKYGRDQGAHKRHLDDTDKWVEIVPMEKGTEFKRQRFEMSAAELNNTRCQ